MTIVNEILEFAGEAVSTNMLDQDAYAASAARLSGHTPGIASQALENAALRNVSRFCHGVAQFIAERYSAGVVNDGDAAKIVEGLTAAIVSVLDENLSVESASETVAGILKLATQAMVNAGEDDTAAITSLKLATRLAAVVRLPTGYRSGLGLSYVSTTSVAVAAGAARDSMDSADLRLAASMTKLLSSTWVSGSGNGGLDTGTVAANKTYHAYLIGGASVSTDVILSLSATAPALPTGYTWYRRVRAVITNASSQVVNFIAQGDEVLLMTPVQAVAVTNLGTTATTYTLPVPTGIRVEAHLTIGAYGATADSNTDVRSVEITDMTPPATGSALGSGIAVVTNVVTPADGGSGMLADIITNTSGQISAKSSAASCALYIWLRGWREYAN